MRRSPVLRRLAAGTLMPGFVGTSVPDWVRRAREDGLGALTLYGSNVSQRDGLGPVLAELHGLGPMVLATDEEGGDVTRVHYPQGSPEPGNAVLGRLDDPAVTRGSARRIGQRLADLGLSLALGPVLDVNSEPDNPVIGVRSFGADPDLVARHGAAWIDGLQSTGVSACAKHFPGHGATRADSHLTLPIVEVSRDVLERRELVPFRVAVRAGVRAVMTSHLLVPALDPDRVMTFSPRAIDGELRQGLGFAGVVVTDALDMAGASGDVGVPEAAVRALVAGCDLLCLGSRTDEGQYDAVLDAVVAAVAADRLSVARLEQAAERVGRLTPAGSSGPGGRSAIDSSDVRAALPITDAFQITDSGRSWLERPGPALLVQVESSSNEAVGAVRWGPASVDPSVVTVGGPGGADLLGAGPCKVAVIGRSIDDRHPAMLLAGGLRERGRAVIVVECGWPRGTADITTFGASPAVATALVDLLTGPRTGRHRE